MNSNKIRRDREKPIHRNFVRRPICNADIVIPSNGVRLLPKQPRVPRRPDAGQKSPLVLLKQLAAGTAESKDIKHP
jgi:hypothetical protein